MLHFEACRAANDKISNPPNSVVSSNHVEPSSSVPDLDDALESLNSGNNIIFKAKLGNHKKLSSLGSISNGSGSTKNQIFDTILCVSKLIL